jgi:hypothetical protein
MIFSFANITYYTHNCWSVLPDQELQQFWAYVLSTSASGLNKFSIQTNISQILECGLSFPKQDKGTGCGLMVPIWMASYKQLATTVHAKR